MRSYKNSYGLTALPEIGIMGPTLLLQTDRQTEHREKTDRQTDRYTDTQTEASTRTATASVTTLP